MHADPPHPNKFVWSSLSHSSCGQQQSQQTLLSSVAMRCYFMRMQSCGTPSVSYKFFIVSFLASSAHRSYTHTPKTVSLPLSLSLIFPSLMFGSVPRMAEVVPAAPQSVQPAGPLKSSSALFSPCPVGLRGGTQIVNDSPPLYLLPSAPLRSAFFF